MSFSVTITERLFIAASPEAVWDFTQSKLHCPLWREHCPKPDIIHNEPMRLVRFQGCGKLSGRWEYERKDGGTEWVQTHTLLIEGPLRRLISPYLKWKLKRATRRSMQRAKEMIAFSKNLSSSIHEDFF